MSHYNTSYTDMTGEAKQAKAIQDIIDYTGEARFADLVDRLVKEYDRLPFTYEELVMPLSMFGIEGYPVKALHMHVANKARGI